jgi:L-lactate dehydrogenase complex protein LldG
MKTPENSRSTMMSRVAAAVRAGKLHRESAQTEIPIDEGYLGAGPDPVARLATELQAVGAYPERCGSVDECQAAIRLLIQRFAVRRAIRGESEVLFGLRIDDLLRAAGVELLTPADLASLDEPTRRDRLFAAELGVAAPDWAIAETGTLVYAAAPEQTRSATLLPPVHLAVVDSSRILSDLFDLPSRLTARSVDGVLPRNVAMVTGPSKTGDIELRLTTGVHGPGEVHVLIWDAK